MESQNLSMNPGCTTYYVTLDTLFNLPEFLAPSTSRKYHPPQNAAAMRLLFIKQPVKWLA